MTEEGMVPIDNPSEFFMTKREPGQLVSGSALTVMKEGTRPIIVEIESLVSHSFTPYPSRIGESIGREQLNTLISILEQRGRIPLYDKNVVIKSTGGIRLREQSVNLAVIMSIVSSTNNTPIDADTLFIADVGLTGELKKVPSLEARIREADSMGFKRVYIAIGEIRDKSKFKDIKAIELNNIQQVIGHIFR